MVTRQQKGFIVAAGAIFWAAICGVLLTFPSGEEAKAPSRLPTSIEEVPSPSGEVGPETPREVPASSMEVEPEIPKEVHPGAFCANPGAIGYTRSGTEMVCKGPGRERWRRK